jgi:alginate O-acetyltransferase complex protein AlgJ
MTTGPDRLVPVTAAPQVPLYARGSREEEAEAALKHTDVRRTTAWLLCGVFLLTVFSELIVQHVVWIHRLAAGPSQPGSRAAGRTAILPRAYDVIDLLPALDQIRAIRSCRDVWNLLPPVDRIKQFETSLEEDSAISACVRPRMQLLLCEFGGAGNEKAYCGRDHWLFYRPEVDYLTGHGFLDPAVLRQRSRAAAGVQPDPRVAIVDFHRQLRARGIELILMPVPCKPMIHPERFADGFDARSGPLQNASYRQLCEDLQSQGVLVFDDSEAMIAAKCRGGPQFLESDTHWRPEAMEAAAGRLAAFIRRHVELGAARTACRRQAARIENLGDIAVMLKLPADERFYAPQGVTIHPVVAADGRPWQPTAGAEVLLLGDSYTNVYSVGAMGWGECAGLAEQLAFALQCPVDRISRNDSGACATREMLRNELLRGGKRLAGTKVVIWEFAVRELCAGDWKTIDLPVVPSGPLTPAPRGKFLELAAGRSVLATGTVAAASGPPRANSPYKDYLMQFHLVDLRAADNSALDADQALVFILTMKDRKILPPARLKPGQKVTLRLAAWSDVAGKYDALRRSELEGDLMFEPVCFGEFP